MILNIITLICIIVKSTRCSIVDDVLNQDATYVSKYCPKQKYCTEGTHVMCMYYNHNQVFGARCGNPVEVQLTPKMVQTILANVNDIRGKVATGTEKGKDDEVLPRAYGLMKLKWDKELAFLAQVLANQCLGGREDACRATEKFPNPSQTIAIIRYKFPNWEYLKPNNTEVGLNEEKVIFSIDRFLKATHALKKSVTKAIIMSCPRLHDLPDVNLKYYLNLIRGGATHIGCGISAYSKYRMGGHTDSIQNNVQIVCNVSDAPKPGQSVYNIVPPIPGQGHSKRCGCPRGYKESRSCLCERDTKFMWKGGPRLKNQLQKDLKRNASKSINNRTHTEAQNDEVKLAAQSQPKFKTNGIKSPRIASKSRHIIKIKGKNSKENHEKEKNIENIETSDEFSRITNAIAPKNNFINSKITDERNDFVIMFSSDPISSKPQDQKTLMKPANAANIFEDLIFKIRTLNTNAENESSTESELDEVKDNLAAKYQKPSQNHVVTNEKADKLEAQNKLADFKHKRLLSILNSLEQEVNNIKFDNNLKQLFDMKMRKIYEAGLNKSQETPSPSKLHIQQDKKDLNDLRRYLENENNVSVENEIATLRRMIHRMSKGTQNDHDLTYAENENNSNQNYKYMDQQFDEYHETKYDNMDHLYEDIPSITALAEHQDYHDKLNNILNSKHNVDHQYDDNNDLRDNSKTRNQETFANNDARQTILSTAVDYNLESYENKKVELEQSAINKIINARQRVERINNQMMINRKDRHLDMNNNVEGSGRRTNTFSDRRLQLSHPFSRRYQNGDMRQMRLWRPNLSTLRQYRNQPRQSMLSSERDTFMY